MKINRFISAFLAVITTLMMLTPIFAAEVRASDQISVYGMDVTNGDGTLDVEFYIAGKGIMDEVGCESIYLYKKVNENWKFVSAFFEDYAGMCDTNSLAHGNTIYIACNDGVEYKVVVTLFAENSAGRDSRTDVFFVTGQSN